MKQRETRQWPFFIMVDDAGFPQVNPRRESAKITMDFYCNVLNLAKQYEMRIPLCFTMKYLDVNHISQEASPLPYAEELIAFLKDNADFIEFGYHGLTHQYEDKPIEFFNIYTDSNVPYEIQRSHISLSFQIIDSLLLLKPKIFVPPGHAWQAGVTDKILSEYGVQYVISNPILRFSRRLYRWVGSTFLCFLPRTSMGIYHADINLDEGIKKNTRLHSVIVNADSVRKTIYPRSLYYNLRCERKLISTPVHSYMTHIGNFSSQAMGFWREILDFVSARKDIHLCRTNVEAERYYKALIGESSSSTC